MRAAFAPIALLALLGCCGSRGQSCQRPAPAPGDAADNDPAWCDRAGAHLLELHCKESRPDFGDFCRYELDAGIPLRPACVAAVQNCDEVASCR